MQKVVDGFLYGAGGTFAYVVITRLVALIFPS